MSVKAPEQVLKEIRDSLEPKSQPSKKQDNYAQFKAKIDALKQVDPSLVSLFRLCDEILSYIDQQRKTDETLNRITVDMKSLTGKVEGNLKRIGDVQEGLSERINRFNLLEAKYTRMIERVNLVLDEITRVLQRL